MLTNTPPEHRGRYVAITPLLLRLVQHIQNNALTVREPVANVGYVFVLLHEKRAEIRWENSLRISPVARSFRGEPLSPGTRAALPLAPEHAVPPPLTTPVGLYGPTPPRLSATGSQHSNGPRSCRSTS